MVHPGVGRIAQSDALSRSIRNWLLRYSYSLPRPFEQVEPVHESTRRNLSCFTSSNLSLNASSHHEMHSDTPARGLSAKGIELETGIAGKYGQDANDRPRT